MRLSGMERERAKHRPSNLSHKISHGAVGASSGYALNGLVSTLVLVGIMQQKGIVLSLLI
jgi:hypothetical protein